jgi:Methyltransferase domain
MSRARSLSRLELVAQLVGTDTSVLDVGCRDKALRDHLDGCDYVGLDLHPPADVIGSAEEALPFADGEFGCVVLADVLEHLDDPYSALDEAMRVGTSVVLALPNVYSLVHRLRFLLRGRLGAKYAFHAEPKRDRHRWVLSYTEAEGFTKARADVAGFTVTSQRAFVYPFKRRSVRALHALARLCTGPDVWAWGYLARLDKR